LGLPPPGRGTLEGGELLATLLPGNLREEGQVHVVLRRDDGLFAVGAFSELNLKPGNHRKWLLFLTFTHDKHRG